MHQVLQGDTDFSPTYFAMLTTAAIMASLGLKQNSAATVIGAMVVAPMMLPIRALGYGLLHFHGGLIKRSIGLIASSIAICVIAGVLIEFLSKSPSFGSEIWSRTSVTFLGLGVALAGGALSAYTRVLEAPTLKDSLVGVGIAVSLVPPLGVIGINLAAGAWAEAGGATLLFITNLIGISLACLLIFWLSGYCSHKSWHSGLSLGIFLILLGGLWWPLSQAQTQAEQISQIDNFLRQHYRQFFPTASRPQPVAIFWNRQPPVIEVTLSATQPPDTAAVTALNQAINQRQHRSYRVFVTFRPSVFIPSEQFGSLAPPSPTSPAPPLP
jgi:uncharacterized hydrophobic protein (TIGR00271 family)